MNTLKYGTYQFRTRFAVAVITAGLSAAHQAGGQHLFAAKFNGNKLVKLQGMINKIGWSDAIGPSQTR